MIGIETSKLFFVPENNAEANGEILGRCNVLHDWVKSEALKRINYGLNPLDEGLRMICTIMGFADILSLNEKEEKETKK